MTPTEFHDPLFVTLGVRRAAEKIGIDPVTPIVWCVKHRTGWCATKNGKSPRSGATNVRTLCKHSVTLPYGFDQTEPTCEECIKILKHTVFGGG